MSIATQEQQAAPSQVDVLANLRDELTTLRQTEKEATAEFHEHCSIEVVDDTDGWGRSIVQVEGLDFPITFRGKSELPDLSKQSNAVVCSLTPVYEVPETEILTADGLKSWSAERGNPLTPETNAEPEVLVARAMDQAIESGKEVMLSVDATPLGICQLLRAIHKEYPPEFFSEDVTELLTYVNEDMIVENPAAQQLLLDMLMSGGGANGIHEDALAVVIASRIGTPENRGRAQEVLNQRTKILNAHFQHQYMVDRDIDTIEQLESGIQYDKEALAQHTDGLVWVHRNKARLAPGGSILPLREFNTQSSRESVHGSLNHVVDNPMAGHGEKLDPTGSTTVIVPLSAAIRANDKPTSLFGVDTYWEDESGVTIPPEAILIHQVPSAEGDLSEREIAIPLNLSKQEAVAFLHDLLQAKPWLLSGAKQAYIQKLKTKDVSEATIAHQAETFERSELSRMITRVEELADDEDLSELVYKIVANLSIRACGGTVVEADGMSAHIEDQGFDARVVCLAKQSGVLTGLHARHPSSPHFGTEAAMTKARSKVFGFEVVEGQKVIKTKAHPEKLDSTALWGRASGSPQKALEWLMAGWLSFEQYEENSAPYKQARSEDPDF